MHCVEQFLNDRVFTEISKYTHALDFNGFYPFRNKQPSCSQPAAFTGITVKLPESHVARSRVARNQSHVARNSLSCRPKSP